jgi:hypothetical protein
VVCFAPFHWDPEVRISRGCVLKSLRDGVVPDDNIAGVWKLGIGHCAGRIVRFTGVVVFKGLSFQRICGFVHGDLRLLM